MLKVFSLVRPRVKVEPCIVTELLLEKFLCSKKYNIDIELLHPTLPGIAGGSTNVTLTNK